MPQACVYYYIWSEPLYYATCPPLALYLNPSVMYIWDHEHLAICFDVKLLIQHALSYSTSS